MIAGPVMTSSSRPVLWREPSAVSIGDMNDSARHLSTAFSACGWRRRHHSYRPRPRWASAGSPFGLLCQNWRVIERPESDLSAVLMDELAACRKRGIERIDIRSHNQQPLLVPELERLASSYATLTARPGQGKVIQLKYLLRDALTGFRSENEADAHLASALFFGDSQHRVTKSAGELLDIAQKQFGYESSVRFRQARRDALATFANFLPRFVANVTHPDQEDAEDVVTDDTVEAVTTMLTPSHADLSLVPEVERHVASTGYIDNGDHFVTLLSQAENVTIVGYTNESLASLLRAALVRKRAAVLRQYSCWSSVRVVFLDDDLLDRVNDERGYPDPDEARLLRRRLSVYGRRTVRIFLRSLPGRASWAIYDSPYFPPLIGTLFEMPDDRRIVHLLVRRRQRSGSDHLYVEIDDTRGHYFSAVFDEIIDSSVDDNRFVPAGRVVEGDRFRTTTNRYRRNVLTDSENENVGDWLPMVLVITWQIKAGRPEPVLQLRTQRNSTRELDRFTHLAGHIAQDKPAALGAEFGIADALPMATAGLRVQMETGYSEPSLLKPLITGQYFHADKEHLFFFVYSYQLPDELQLWPRAEMSALSVQELMSVRKTQTLLDALTLCQRPPRRGPARGAAFEIVALNLLLHDYTSIADRIAEAGAARSPDLDSIAVKLGELEEQARQPPWPAFEGEVHVVGLSGFQFRHFFETLLPFYARVDVPDAADVLSLIHDDNAKRAAVARLSQMYNDERLMRSISIEL